MRKKRSTRYVACMRCACVCVAYVCVRVVEVCSYVSILPLGDEPGMRLMEGILTLWPVLLSFRRSPHREILQVRRTTHQCVAVYIAQTFLSP